MKCAYCRKESEGNYSMHRDGIDTGPQVDLCDTCASVIGPSLEEIWAKIRYPEPVIEAIKEANEA